MQPRSSHVTAFFVPILAVILVLIAGASIFPNASPTTIPPSSTLNVQEESVEVQVTPAQGGPSLDGPSLLQKHCSQCHLVRLFEQPERPRAEWEQALSRMERFDVRLIDAERSVLLDYLVGPGKP